MRAIVEGMALAAATDIVGGRSAISADHQLRLGRRLNTRR